MSEFKTVQLKRSNTAGAIPSTAQLVEGELVINLADKKLYSRDSSAVFALNTIDDGSITTSKIADNNVTFSKLAAEVLNAIYPVGSIYTNATVSTNPATLLGFGTWSAFGAGRVMVGLDSSNTLFDTVGETGGSADAIVVSHTHTATVTDPGHKHTMSPVIASTYTNACDGGLWRASPNQVTETNNATTGITVANSTEGSSGINANYQPYITVYMWKRTA